MQVRILALDCLRCGHTWLPRKADVRLCPKCKSPFFDVEKEQVEKIKAVYHGKRKS